MARVLSVGVGVAESGGGGGLGAVRGLVPEHVGLVALQHEGVGVGDVGGGDVLDVEAVVVCVCGG